MARSEIVYLTDDFTGKADEGTETIPFMMEDGKPREIDLNPKNARIFREKMKRYVEASRIVTSKPTKRGGKRAASDKRREDAADIRHWANENGIEIKVRGRIPSDIVAKYDARNTKTVPTAASSEIASQEELDRETDLLLEEHSDWKNGTA